MYLIINIVLLFLIMNCITMILINKKKDKIKRDIENFENEIQTKVFKLMTYNVKMFSNYIFDDAQKERAHMIPTEINKIDPELDCIIITELFNEKAEKIMDKQMKKYGYKHRSKKVGTSWWDIFKLKIEDGGVKIYSKYPIIEQEILTYNNSSAEEKLSGKGCLYTKIDKYGKNFNIIATHLQSGRTEEKIKTRIKQIEEMKDFIDKLKITFDEPIFIAGDFNIDKTRQKELLQNTLNILEANPLEVHVDSLGDTSNTDFSTREIHNNKKKSHHKWLDHIFYMSRYKNPEESNMKSVRIKKDGGYLIKTEIGEKMFKFKKYGDYIRIYDLSNHHGLIGEFLF